MFLKLQCSSFGYRVQKVLQNRNGLCLCFIDEKQRAWRSFQMSGNPCEKDMQYINVRPKGRFPLPWTQQLSSSCQFLHQFLWDLSLNRFTGWCSCCFVMLTFAWRHQMCFAPCIHFYMFTLSLYLR